eukprot:scaffold615_cov259-Chaetoceros_neogracile.AAC.26
MTLSEMNACLSYPYQCRGFGGWGGRCMPCRSTIISSAPIRHKKKRMTKKLVQMMVRISRIG